MASTIQYANLTSPLAFLPTSVPTAGYRNTFEQNRHRVYALAFWMTDHELMAESLMQQAFTRAFATAASPSAEQIDEALVAELRTLCPLGTLTLSEPAATEVFNVRRNTLRVHLERAVVQVPHTERLIFLMHDVEGYDHARIARTLGITQEQSQAGLHQARLRVRNLVAAMPR
ncbi:MAG: RNA polymerase sigma factor [Candidatus Korobacteraceae bacterium]